MARQTSLVTTGGVPLDEDGRVKVVLPAGGSGLTDDELRASALHVVVDSAPATGGGLTDDELRAAPLEVDPGVVPVTDNGGSLTVDGSVAVSNFPATQAVSAAALPLPSGASTEATLALIKAKTDNLDVALSTRAVTGLTDTQLRATALPVSGTFWQATQPVSGTVAVSNATLAVTGTFWQATQPVSGTVTVGNASIAVTGTFWQATQPISAASLPLPSGAAQEHTTAASPHASRLTDGSAFYDARTIRALTSADVVTIVPPTLTKGTQGPTGVSVQPLRDAGRVLCVFAATAIATVTSEALVTLTPYRDLTAGGGATTFAVTSNKKLRLQSLILTIRATSTVNVGGIVRFRMLAGTVLVGSPVVFAVGGMSSNLATAVAGNAQTYFVDFPEGFEMSGTMQFGLTQLFSATTATIDVTVIGYEY